MRSVAQPGKKTGGLKDFMEYSEAVPPEGGFWGVGCAPLPEKLFEKVIREMHFIHTGILQSRKCISYNIFFDIIPYENI